MDILKIQMEIANYVLQDVGNVMGLIQDAQRVMTAVVST